MTKHINDGGFAFPQCLNAEGPFGGLSIRDWFAGQAMQGILAHYGDDGDIGRVAYRKADEMLAARQKESK